MNDRPISGCRPTHGLPRPRRYESPWQSCLGLATGHILVLPDRIELSTSPLPRECSTTELRQRPAGDARNPARKRAILAIRAHQVQAGVGVIASVITVV
jgi:hypothetical protein